MAFKLPQCSKCNPRRKLQPVTSKPVKPSHKELINQFYQEYTEMNAPSSFDPSVFLDAQVSEPSIKRPPLPLSCEVIGMIGEPKVSSGVSTKSGEPRPWTRVDLPIEIDLTSRPELKAVVGVDKVTITDGVMLDLTPANTIDNAPGKNGKMRRYREATNLNSPGQSFSFRMLQGRSVKCKIKHETYEGENYDRIDAVAAVV